MTSAATVLVLGVVARRSLVLRVRFEPARLAKETSRTAYQMIVPMRRVLVRRALSEASEKATAVNRPAKEQVS